MIMSVRENVIMILVSDCRSHVEMYCERSKPRQLGAYSHKQTQEYYKS